MAAKPKVPAAKPTAKPVAKAKAKAPAVPFVKKFVARKATTKPKNLLKRVANPKSLNDPRAKPNPPPDVILPQIGRPTVYQPGYDEIARRLYMLMQTDEEVASFFQISGTTLERWVQVHPSFSAARAHGKDIIDTEIIASLAKRAKGFKRRAVKIMVVDKEVERHEYDEYFPPDAKAAEFWLTNRRGKQWKSRRSEDDTNGNTLTVNVIGGLPPDEPDK